MKIIKTKKYLTALVKRIIAPISGKIGFQKIFESLYLISLEAMNIGRGADFKDSGEKYVLSYIKKYFKNLNKIIIFDVGANTGNYSILLDKIFGKKSIIYSFEPSKYTFDKLKMTTKEKENIYLYNFGFSDENSKVTIYSDSNGSGLASIYKRRMDHYNVYLDKAEEIEVKKIDSFCTEQKIDQIHFLKLDVEGHEFKVLDGSSQMLKLGKIDFIQFEFGQCDIDSKTFFQDFYYLLKDDYIIYRVLKNGLYELKDYKETYELFRGTTNYLAMSKGLK